ncbi:MAG TPA: FAD-dependent oxidoreductase [Terriglobales bacterium]
MKTWNAIIAGGGIIGLSLAIALRKRGLQVLVVERGEPGREASHAAAGMLAECPIETPAALRALARASAAMYPEFVHELEDESGVKVDLRDSGTILFTEAAAGLPGALASLQGLEPNLAAPAGHAYYLEERSVDPRTLVAAAIQAARHRKVDISSGSPVLAVLAENGRVTGVQTDRTSYQAPVVVNCAGAWACQVSPYLIPTRPVKGQILSVIGGPTIRHVVRAPEVYLVPRSDGRIVIGATAEDAGYDKRTNPETIQKLYRAAARLAPGLAKAKIHEAWAGLRPGTPDGLPVLGPAAVSGYFAATGHFRDGILLAPVTAAIMAELITEGSTAHDVSAFSPDRFEKTLQRAG